MWDWGWPYVPDAFHLSLDYAADKDATPTSSASEDNRNLGFQIHLRWTASEDEDKVTVRLQSEVSSALRSRHDVEGNLGPDDFPARVEKEREPLRRVTMWKSAKLGQEGDGMGVFSRLMRSNFSFSRSAAVVAGCAGHWKGVVMVNISGVGLSVLPVEVTQLPLLKELYVSDNKLSTLPHELGSLKHLKVLAVDRNVLLSVPVELSQCDSLIELSMEHNRLIRPNFNFRSMAQLHVLRLLGNPLEFLPDILPLDKLCHLSLVNIRIIADDNLQIKIEDTPFLISSPHKLSFFFSLIFRFSACQHILLVSAVAKLMQDEENRYVVGNDKNAVQQLMSMICNDDQHVVEQACSVLSSLASDFSVAMQLIKFSIMQRIQEVLKSPSQEKKVISVLQIVVKLAFTSDIVAHEMLTEDMLKSLELLCADGNTEVQRLALLAAGNLAFCLDNRHTLVTSKSLRNLLARESEPSVNKAAARALAILGENEELRRAIGGRQIPKRGLRILSMDGGGMKGLATIRMLREIEKGTGKQIHDLFDLICGTSTGGILAVALGIKLMSLKRCEEIYKELGKHVFAESAPEDNEEPGLGEKMDQIYKSSTRGLRAILHGSKYSTDQFERLLKEICADEDGDLLIESAVKRVPKVFVLSTLVSVAPAQPFIFRNYQYPAGTLEISSSISENLATDGLEEATAEVQVGSRRNAILGSCKHLVWQAIRASSAAPYYFDDFSDGAHSWQDGAIVANNPTIFAIREAQLLWPDSKIDCLVSIGCGSVPIKVRKCGWRLIDTIQMLIESVCSVDRVEEALSTLRTLFPDVQYFRFKPVDDRCEMELDETNPAILLKLEAATDDYIKKNSQSFNNLCEKLLQNSCDDKFPDCPKQLFRNAKDLKVVDNNSPSLGMRRGVLLVEASNGPESERVFHHARSLEKFCDHAGITLSLVNDMSGTLEATAESTFATSFTSPLFTGCFKSSPLFYSPFPKTTASPTDSPAKHRQLSVPILSLPDKLQNSPQVGVIHLALQNDLHGSVLSWKNDVFVVAEPGELADKFLQTIKCSPPAMFRGRWRKNVSIITDISTISDLVSSRPNFQIGDVVHRYIGRQTQVMKNEQEIAAYMFRRTLPSVCLTPEDVRLMVGAWRDRIIIFTGICGPTDALVKSLLDSGAKAVICPSAKPEETQLTTFQGSDEFSGVESERVELGDEVEGEGMESPSLTSEPERNVKRSRCFWDDDHEELSEFVCKLYGFLFGGAPVSEALKNALALHHHRLRYSCHLPNRSVP
ncbi:hypothetical protein ACH5RR_017630 [Cinchona calisaya]|uniref:PNPLA domain-containing protein n=1 Tax=Cinchona calisaya TaxID=153742 RepID=A0ABD2ZJ78_9GENT